MNAYICNCSACNNSIEPPDFETEELELETFRSLVNSNQWIAFYQRYSYDAIGKVMQIASENDLEPNETNLLQIFATAKADFVKHYSEKIISNFRDYVGAKFIARYV